MNGKEEFDSAQTDLKRRFENTERADWKTRSRLLEDLAHSDGWTLIKELIQNALDAGADSIKIRQSDDSLSFAHNGSDKLDCDSIKGLCGFQLSTKGLDSVGFMGLGFKSFVHFFGSVTIADSDVRFTIRSPKDEGWLSEISELYKPLWVEDPIDIPSSMKTVFKFEEPRVAGEEYLESAMSKISKALDNIYLKQVTIMGTYGLRKLQVNDSEYEVVEENNYPDTITVSDSENQESFLVLKESIQLSAEATLALARHRKSDDLCKEGKTTTRDFRLIKKVKKVEDSNGNYILHALESSTTGRLGEMYCLSLLENGFPFGFIVDTDWLMNSARTRLSSKHPIWHRELLSALPKLILKYLEHPKKPTPDDNTEYEKWHDIFPFGEEITGVDISLGHLNSEDFKGKMRDLIGKSKFINCISGTVESPNTARYLPRVKTIKIHHYPPSQYSTGHYYHSKTDLIGNKPYFALANDCFDCDVLKETSLSLPARKYLRSINLLDYPSEKEILSKNIQDLWDSDKIEKYLKILDVLSIITDKDSEGPEVIPLADDSWEALSSNYLLFESMPSSRKNGNERALFDPLVQRNPQFNDSREVRDELKEKPEKGGAGIQWRASNPGVSYSIAAAIESLTTRKTRDYVIARFAYSLRTDQPSLVTDLVTVGGIKEVEEVIIGPPFVKNALVTELFPRQIQHKSIDEIRKKRNVKIAGARKFLHRCGAKLLIPQEERMEPTNDWAWASDFMGMSVHDPLEQGPWRATGKGDNYGKWTPKDWVWPFDIMASSGTKALSDYLSDPPKYLIIGINNSGKKSLEFFYKQDQDKPGKSQPGWVASLREAKWVLCSDDEIRKPEDSYLEEEGMDYRALIDAEFMKNYERHGVVFGTNLGSLSNAQLMEHWSNRQVTDISSCIKALKALKKKLDSDDLKEKVLDLQFATGRYGKAAPLRRFAKNVKDSLGGWFGESKSLDKRILKFARENGIEIQESVTDESILEFINSNSTGNDKDFDRDKEQIREAYRILIERDADIERAKVKTYGGNWYELNEKELYVQFVHDGVRCRAFADDVARTDQFPSELESLRWLTQKRRLILLDNEMTIDTNTGIDIAEDAGSLLRIKKSLDLDLQIKHCKGPGIDVDFDGREITLAYLIREEDGRAVLYISDDSAGWSEQLVRFIRSQKDIGSDNADILREAIQRCREDGFEEPYRRLCDSMGLKIFEFDDIVDEIVESSGETGSESDAGKPSSQKKPARILDYEKDPPSDTESSGGESDKETQSDTSGTNTKSALAEQRRRKKRNGGKKSGMSQKEIGDKAEQEVVNQLESEGWGVENMNEKRDRENFPGYDLLAKKDNIERRVEVKGKEHGWSLEDKSSVKLTFQQLLHCAKTVVEANGGESPQYWLYVVAKVSEDYSRCHITPIELSREKPDIRFNSSTWSKN